MPPYKQPATKTSLQLGKRENAKGPSIMERATTIGYENVKCSDPMERWFRDMVVRGTKNSKEYATAGMITKDVNGKSGLAGYPKRKVLKK